MSKLTAFALITYLRIFFHPSDTEKGIDPFTSPFTIPASTHSISPARILSFNGTISDQKVILDWEVGGNDTADRFEVMRSADGKTFAMAALVFGTDKPETGHYRFYEKAGSKKITFRIILINKNQQAEYSDLLEINPPF